MIDTDYTSLTEIDSEIVHFYSEDTRQRVIGYEEGEGGVLTPIIEEYTVIVLNKPEEVEYSEVAKRRGERKPEAVVTAELERAIEWEEFHVNHDLYLSWNDEFAQWEEEQPTEPVYNEETGEWEDQVVPAPVRPVVTLDARREHYKIVEVYADAKYNNNEEGYDEEHDDDEYVTTRTHYFTPKPDAEIAAMHSGEAFMARYDAIYAPLTITLEDGTEATFDIGKGKDGVSGISNIESLLLGLTHAQPDELTEPIDWILADNTVKGVMISDLGKVLVAFNIRKQIIFAQYSTWRDGDRLQPFSSTEE